MQISEVREADAPPQIQAIFADIKAVSNVPQVNLIWRHFATEPDILGWSWAVLRPAFVDGRIPSAAARLVAEVRGDGLGALSDAYDEPLAKDLRAILAYYNNGNPQNLLALTTLTKLGSSTAERTREGEGKATETVPLAAFSHASHDEPVPALPKRDDLPDEVCERIDAMAARHGGAALGVTPSMYLHLGLYPDALAAADARIAALLARADFKAEVSKLIARADLEAERISSELSQGASANTPPRPDPARLDPMLATASNFVTTTIPEMIVVGAALAGAAES